MKISASTLSVTAQAATASGLIQPAMTFIAGEGADLEEARGGGAVADPPLLDLQRPRALRLGEDAERAGVAHPGDVGERRQRQEGAGGEGGAGRADCAQRRQAEAARHQHQVDAEVEQVGDPHQQHRRRHPAQPLQPGRGGRARARSWASRPPGPAAARSRRREVALQPQRAEQQRPEDRQHRRRGDADPERVGEAAPQRRAGGRRVPSPDRPRGHHLHAGEQAHRRAQHGARRPPSPAPCSRAGRPSGGRPRWCRSAPWSSRQGARPPPARPGAPSRGEIVSNGVRRRARAGSRRRGLAAHGSPCDQERAESGEERPRRQRR